MQNTRCVVFVYPAASRTAIPAGVLEATTDCRYVFRYGKKYLHQPSAEPVDYINLPLVSEPLFLTEDNLGAIRDAAPDYWGRLVFQKVANIPEPSEIDYLLAPNAVRIGNLDFRQSPLTPEPAFDLPEYADLPDIMSVAEAIESGTQLNEQQRKTALLLKIGSSLGGARPKCAVEIDEQLWLAKFPSKDDKFSNAKIEAATMFLAAQAGITVPEIFVKDISGRDVFFIKRFDRATLDVRKPYMSSLSMMGISEYDHRNFSYLALANRMKTLGSTGDLTELFRRIVCNIVVRNTDDHPRNHGFLYENGTWNLSPAFDITPTASTQGISSIARLAMACGEQGNEASKENLLSAAGVFGLSRDEASILFDQTANTISQNWRSAFAKFEVSEADAERFQHTFSAFGNEEHHGEEESSDTWAVQPGY